MTEEWAPRRLDLHRLPGARGLGQPVSHHEQHRRMVAQTAVAANHFYRLVRAAPGVHTCLPGDDAISATEHRCRRHRQRRVVAPRSRSGYVRAPRPRQRSRQGSDVTLVSRHGAERAPQGHDRAYRFWAGPGDLTGVDPAQAPPDQAQRPRVMLVQSLQAVTQPPDHLLRRDVGAQPPAMDAVTQTAQEPTQRLGRPIIRSHTGQHENGMTIPPRSAGQQRSRRLQPHQFAKGSRSLRRQQQPTRSAQPL